MKSGFEEHGNQGEEGRNTAMTEVSPMKNAPRVVVTLMAITGCLTAGCGGLSTHEQVAFAITVSNGSELNGVHMNGPEFNGVHMNGVSLNGVILRGDEPLSVHLEGEELMAARGDGTSIAGMQLVGAEFSGALSDGSTVPVRIAAIGFAPAPNTDLYAYQVEYSSPDGSGWQPLCGLDAAGLPIAAFPVKGMWDERQNVPGGGSHIAAPGWFSFACRGAAIAKCIEWGYRPWRSVAQCDRWTCRQVSLETYHQACTRMVRADYCGNGHPWTINGRSINVYDGLKVQTDTEAWLFEAEWRGDGARCLSNQRVIQLQANLGTLGVTSLPECILSRVDAGCGQTSHFGTGTLLMSEYQTQYVGVSLALPILR